MMAQAVKNIQEQEESEKDVPIPLETQSPFYDVTFPITPKSKKESEPTPSELQSPFFNTSPSTTEKKIKARKEKNDTKKNRS
ncbi:MAG: hypothetical protein ACTSRK_16890 [Promethearchaeota archaeon]